MAKISADEVRRVKGLGCLQDKRYDDVFNVRVITRNGKITSDECATVAEAARIYGSGEVAMTTRLTMEIQGVKHEKLEELFGYLNEHGLTTGGTGAKVRPVVSCKGTTCQYGLIDTYGLSLKIHEKFYVEKHDVALPHKFKIAVGGCPNNCVKPDLNDVGIIGAYVPAIDREKCKECRKCLASEACPVKAFVRDGVTPDIIREECNDCGRCAPKCPFKAVGPMKRGYRMVIGGRWGKRSAMGEALPEIFETEEEVLDALERAFELFRDEGIKGERFSDTIARLGFDYVSRKIMGNE